MKIPVLFRILRKMHRSGMLDLLTIWAFARKQAERAVVGLPYATGFGSQAAWNRSNRRAGGARVGKPIWSRILTVTGGFSMACPEQPVEGAARIFKAPPQVGQCSMSKTRLSSLARLMRFCAPCA